MYKFSFKDCFSCMPHLLSSDFDLVISVCAVLENARPDVMQVSWGQLPCLFIHFKPSIVLITGQVLKRYFCMNK